MTDTLIVTRHEVHIGIVTDLDLEIRCVCGWHIVIDAVVQARTTLGILTAIGAAHICDVFLSAGVSMHSAEHEASTIVATFDEAEFVSVLDDRLNELFPFLAREFTR